MKRLSFITGLLQFKILMSFLLLIIVVSISFTGIYINYLKSSIEKELIQKYSMSLKQLRDNVDGYILETVQNTVINNLNLNPDIKKLFYVPFKNNSVYASRTWEEINRIVNPSEFYHGIYIYYKQNDLVIANTGIFLLTGKNKENYNFNWITESTDTLYPWIYINDFGKYNPQYAGKSILAYVKRFPLNSGNNKSVGAYAVAIDIERAYKKIQNFAMPTFENMVMIDRNGNVIYNKGMDVFRPDNFLNNFSNNVSGFYELPSQKSKTFVFYSKSEVGEFYYISAVDILPEVIQKLFVDKEVFLIVCTELLLLIILSVIWTKRLYSPIGILITRIKTISKEVLGQDVNTYKEDQVLISTVKGLVDKVQELQNKVVFDEPEIKNSFLRQLFFSTNSERKNIQRLIARLNVEFPFQLFQCLYIKFENSSTLENVKLETIKYNIIYFIENIHINDCVKFATVLYDGGIGVLVNSRQQEVAVRLAKDIMEYVKTINEVDIYIGMGNGEHELYRISKSYRNAVEAISYSFLYPEQKIFISEIIAKGHKKEYEDIGIKEEMRKQLVSDFDLEKTKSYVNYILRAIKNEKYMLSSVKKYINEIAEAINEKLEYYDSNQLLDLSIAKNINEASEKIIEALDRFKTIVIEKEKDRMIKVVEIIQKYIREQISKNQNEDISLVSISERFNISPNYLSKIFKDVTGMGFKEFIIDVKLEKAVEILSMNKDIKVSDLAIQLGYTNISYFIRIFRDKYGCTPKEYVS
ncbi:MAG TPA: AraC family transcriptional regulator [Clostridiaceae bacterium]|nr:AraC family transcriptional regulator [Clostridiaceae bacterium]